MILVGVAGFSYYGQHLAPAATVGGQTITKDDFTDAAKIEIWRLQQQQAAIPLPLRATEEPGQFRVRGHHSYDHGEW